jgi:hypothetical protein
MARLHSKGPQSGLGAFAEKNSHPRVAAIIAGFRPVFPILDRWRLRGECFNHGRQDD